MNNLSKIQKKLLRFKKSNLFNFLISISSFSLVACGKDDGTEDIYEINGFAIKGPLTKALVFSDLNANNVFDLGEPNSLTGSDGNFSFNTSNSSSQIIVIGQPNSIDISSGSSAEGIVLLGSSSNNVISPTSTLIAKSNLQPEEIAKTLGLEGIDILNFNPYGSQADISKALEVEKINHQIQNLISSLITSTEVAGLDTLNSQELSLNTLVNIIAEKSVQQEIIDLSSSALISEIKTKLLNNATVENNINQVVLETSLETTLKAAENVNFLLTSVSNLNSDDAVGIFSLGSLLRNELKSFIETESVQSISLSNLSDALNSANNLPPQIKSLPQTLISENITNLSIGKVVIQDESSIIQFNLSGADSDKLLIDSNGIISFKNSPNFETKNIYSVIIKITDEGNKDTVTDFSFLIVDENDSPSGKPQIIGDAYEDSILSIDTSSIEDEDGIGDFTISWLKDSKIISSGSNNTYTLNQDDVGSTFSATISYTDGGNYVETLVSETTAIIQNINDEPTGNVLINGTGQLGSNLSLSYSSLNDEDGIDLSKISISWYRDDFLITGQSNSNYTVTEEDVGKSISAIISYTDGHGKIESVKSSPKSIIDNTAHTDNYFSIINKGSGPNLILEFYLDLSIDTSTSTNGFNELGAKINFSTTEALFQSYSFPTDLVGYILEDNKDNGIIELAAVAYPKFTDLNNPVFTINMTDVDLENSMSISISDIIVDNDLLLSSNIVIT